MVDSIWKQFEGKAALDRPMDPHFWGAFYSQAVVAWLCAWRGGMASDGLAEAVRRAGRCLVAFDKAKGRDRGVRGKVCERMHAEYIAVASVPVWGSQKEDIVHTAFYK